MCRRGFCHFVARLWYKIGIGALIGIGVLFKTYPRALRDIYMKCFYWKDGTKINQIIVINPIQTLVLGSRFICMLSEHLLKGFCRVWLHRMAMFGFCLRGCQMAGGMWIMLMNMATVLMGCWVCHALVPTWRSLSVEGISHSLMPFMALIGPQY